MSCSLRKLTRRTDEGKIEKILRLKKFEAILVDHKKLKKSITYVSNVTKTQPSDFRFIVKMAIAEERDRLSREKNIIVHEVGEDGNKCEGNQSRS